MTKDSLARQLISCDLCKVNHSDTNRLDAHTFALNSADLEFEESKPKFCPTSLLVLFFVAVLSVWLAACTNNTAPTIISVSVSCSPWSILSNQTSQCRASVKGTGSFNPSVTWTQTTGSVSPAGVFSPPSVNSQTQVTITGTSVQDPTKSGSTTITVNPSSTITSVTDSCSPSTIQSGQTSQCVSTVQGTGIFNTSVTWTASSGTITSSGLYTAPTVTAVTQVAIAATSVQDPTRSDTAIITVNPTSTITSVVVSCNPNVLQLPIPNAAYPNSQCSAVVQGTGSFDSTVTWQSSPGSIGTTSGVYTPPTVTVQTIATITATSAQDPTKSGSTTLTINPVSSNCPSGGQPAVLLSPPAAGASQLYGLVCNVDTTRVKVVIYALTNQWYVQPFVNAPFTDISNDGSWSTSTFPWDVLVVLLVDPTSYTPAATSITNPALDSNVIAWTIYPPGPISVDFSNYVWGIKITGSKPGYTFDPGPNHWSNDPSVITVTPDGRLHLKITQINGVWQCPEIHLLKSLGYGIYTIQVDSHVDGLDQNTVAAPLFIYAAPGQELDNEYSGLGGLIPAPFTAQVVVQPFTVPGNIVRYTQPSAGQFTTQMEWRADHVTFTTWNGWTNPPAPSDIIEQWTYTGAYIPPVGNERVRINLWLLNGAAPTNSTGDSMIISSFSFQP